MCPLAMWPFSSYDENPKIHHIDFLYKKYACLMSDGPQKNKIDLVLLYYSIIACRRYSLAVWLIVFNLIASPFRKLDYRAYSYTTFIPSVLCYLP